MPVMYCPRDQRNVETVRGYSLGLLIVLLIITLIGGIIYYLLANKPKCPYCGSKELMAPAMSPMGGQVMLPGQPMAPGQMMVPGQLMAMPGQPVLMTAQPAAAPSAPCPSCGRPATWYPQQNRWFCAAEQKWV
jgi:hypothetical protein